MTRLIFPSAEHQQGFTVVSRRVALHGDGKHTEQRMRRTESGADCLPTAGQPNLESLVTWLQISARHIDIVQDPLRGIR